MQCARVENGNLILGRIDIGSRCFVGSHSAFGLDVRMGDDCRLDDQSLLPDGVAMPAGEQRRGSPAKELEVPVPRGPIFLALVLRAGGLCGLLLAHWQRDGRGGAGASLAIVVFWRYAFQQGWIWNSIWITAALMPGLIVVSCLWVALLKAVLLRRAKPGIYRLYSVLLFAALASARAMRSGPHPVSADIHHDLFAAVDASAWRQIGKYAEMSTIWSFMPELLDAGDLAFFADGCILGGRRIFGGRFEIRINRIGNRSFIGNGAFMSSGAALGDGCLLGVLSAPPSTASPNAGWNRLARLSRLPIAQPTKVGGFDEEATYRPTRGSICSAR